MQGLITLHKLLATKKRLEDEAQKAKAQETSMAGNKHPTRISAAEMFTRKPSATPAAPTKPVKEPVKRDYAEVVKRNKKAAEDSKRSIDENNRKREERKGNYRFDK
jgi:hypothetical protein